MSLNEDYVNLKNTYRELFALCLEEAGKVDNFEQVWAAEIKSGIEKFCLEREQYMCAGCGCCCRFAVSEFSPEELKLKANNGDNYASQFSEIFVPYSSVEEARKIYPEYVEFLENLTDGEFYIYHCPRVTEDNRCSDYENRPQICRDFPEISSLFLPKSCAFSPWKLKSMPVWLKINAMMKIAGFYKNNMKEHK